MAAETEPLDITNNPELLELAEEVRRTGESRVLRRDGEDVAVITPVPTRKRRSRTAKPLTKEDEEAFVSSAGSWKDFDLERFLEDNEASRRLSRPPVEL